jgi:hypothetical protein
MTCVFVSLFNNEKRQFYNLTLLESGCISGKFVGNLSYRLGKDCPSEIRCSWPLGLHFLLEPPAAGCE